MKTDIGRWAKEHSKKDSISNQRHIIDSINMPFIAIDAQLTFNRMGQMFSFSLFVSDFAASLKPHSGANKRARHTTDTEI